MDGHTAARNSRCFSPGRLLGLSLSIGFSLVLRLAPFFRLVSFVTTTLLVLPKKLSLPFVQRSFHPCPCLSISAARLPKKASDTTFQRFPTLGFGAPRTDKCVFGFRILCSFFLSPLWDPPSTRSQKAPYLRVHMRVTV